MEHFMRRRTSRKCRTALLLGLALTGAGVAMAEDVVVQVQSLTIRSGKGSMYPSIGEATNNQHLEVIEHQADGWLKVRLAGKEGYVKQSALTPRSPGMFSGASSGMNALTGNNSDAGAAAAARGIKDDVAQYAASKNYNTAALEQMIANRNRVAGQRWIQFTQEGQVGPSKP